MQYTLITPEGRVYQFFIQTVAEQFRQAYGGTLIDNSVVQMAETTV